jgi:hypothetical protein
MHEYFEQGRQCKVKSGSLPTCVPISFSSRIRASFGNPFNDIPAKRLFEFQLVDAKGTDLNASRQERERYPPTCTIPRAAVFLPRDGHSIEEGTRIVSTYSAKSGITASESAHSTVPRIDINIPTDIAELLRVILLGSHCGEARYNNNAYPMSSRQQKQHWQQQNNPAQQPVRLAFLSDFVHSVSQMKIDFLPCTNIGRGSIAPTAA